MQFIWETDLRLTIQKILLLGNTQATLFFQQTRMDFMDSLFHTDNFMDSSNTHCTKNKIFH